MKSTGKKKIEYGNVDLPEDEFADHNVKMRVTTLVDLDALKALKAEAARQKKPYQTLLNETIRRAFLQEPTKEPELSDAERREVRKLISPSREGPAAGLPEEKKRA